MILLCGNVMTKTGYINVIPPRFGGVLRALALVLYNNPVLYSQRLLNHGFRTHYNIYSMYAYNMKLEMCWLFN